MTNVLSIKRLNTQLRIIKIDLNKGTLKREGLLTDVNDFINKVSKLIMVQQDMCVLRRRFFHLQKVDGEHLYMRNSSISKVLGIEKVIRKMTFEKLLTLNNVLHIVDIRKNLL